MLRLTEIRLPLDHSPDELQLAILERLQIKPDALLNFTISRRGFDARKRSAIIVVYTLDVEVADEEQLLQRFENERHIKPTPDTEYKFVAHAPENLKTRPVIIGTGPCGFMAGLLLAQMGFKPLILECTVW